MKKASSKTATKQYGKFEKTFRGVKLTRIATSKADAAYLKRHGWKESK